VRGVIGNTSRVSTNLQFVETREVYIPDCRVDIIIVVASYTIR
jgi:hypothetical protein